jgi:hypothetical protein
LSAANLIETVLRDSIYHLRLGQLGGDRYSTSASALPEASCPEGNRSLLVPYLFFRGYQVPLGSSHFGRKHSTAIDYIELIAKMRGMFSNNPGLVLPGGQPLPYLGTIEQAAPLSKGTFHQYLCTPHARKASRGEGSGGLEITSGPKHWSGSLRSACLYPTRLQITSRYAGAKRFSNSCYKNLSDGPKASSKNKRILTYSTS